MPNVPTMAEAGIKDFVVTSWAAYVIPAATPRAIVDRLSAAQKEFANDAALQKRFLEAGGRLLFSTPVGPPGNGTINQLAVEWLAIEANLKFLHVPYRGGAPAAVAVAAGDVPIGALTPSSAQPLVEASKVKVLALMTKQRPSFAPPDWPTLAEHGLAVDAALWVALFAPTGTPQAIVDRLDQVLTEGW